MSRQHEYLADARAVQFTRSKNGLVGVLRKALGQGHADRTLHPSLQHMPLLGTEQSRWLATHPPIAERIRRIRGRTLGAVGSQEVAPTRPDLLV